MRMKERDLRIKERELRIKERELRIKRERDLRVQMKDLKQDDIGIWDVGNWTSSGAGGRTGVLIPEFESAPARCPRWLEDGARAQRRRMRLCCRRACKALAVC